MKKRILSLALALVLAVSLLPMPKAEAAGSATGQQIVNCAMQYLGKVPYVWGGKTIDGANPGADCSGFICRIYEKFGFDFWANRTKLRNCGTNLGTDLSVAQLGDIIWFDGHVAIYAGKSNGSHMIVHETGGDFQNVVYTKVSVVKAELKGIIRIPGVTNGSTTTNLSSTLFYGKVHDTNGSLAINDKAAVSPQNSNQIGKIPEGGTCIVYTNKTSGNWWWVEYNGVQGWAYKKYITLGSAVPVYYLDLNGYLDGRNVNNISGYGTVDVYINGSLTANDCTDYYVQWPAGTKYEIKDIRAASGYSYGGVRAGSVSGTISNGDVNVRLTFSAAAAKTFTATFYLNESCSAVETRSVTQNQTYGTLPDAQEKAGYTFDGWYTAASGGTQITATTVFNGSADITLYPHYTKNAAETVTIHYCMDGKEVITQTAEIGSTYNSDYFIKEGCTFVGWYSSETGGTRYDGTIITATSPRILYARYEPAAAQQYTVYLYVNGAVLKTLTVTNGGTYGTLPTPSLSGYTFDGWYTAATGGTRVTGSTTVNLTANQTLYAHFTKAAEAENKITLQIGNPKMTVNGVSQAIDAQGTLPLIRNNRTLLPVRAVFEAMNGTVGWDGVNRIVSLAKGVDVLYLKIDSATAWDNHGTYYTLDSAPAIINNRTMLPIRFIVEYFNGTVEWDATTRTVTVYV